MPPEELSNGQLAGYLRAVEGRLAALERDTRYAEASRAELRAMIAELRTAMAQQSHEFATWRRQIEVAAAARSWIDRAITGVIVAATTSGLWWLKSGGQP